MSLLDRIAEDKIKAAQERGEFDNLPGKGKPLHLEENPHEPEDWRIAFHILRNSGVRPPWMETAAEIERELEAARQEAASAFRHAASPSAWRRQAARFLDRIAALNRKIFHYNLQVPSSRFQRLPIDPAKELAAIEGGQSASPTSS
jgi:DnaJ family protein C protein 28